MPIFTGLAGLAKGAKVIGGKIAARKATTAAAKKATTAAAKKATTAAAGVGATAAGANFIKNTILGVSGKITGGLKQVGKKVATLRKKDAALKAGALGAGVVAGAGIGHQVNQQRKEEQRREEQRQEQRREEQRREEQRRQEEATIVDTAQISGSAKSIWKKLSPPFMFLLLILLFLLFLSERERK